MRLTGLNSIDNLGVICHKLNVTHDTHIREGGCPVPAGHVKRLSEVRVSRCAVEVIHQEVLCLLSCHFEHGRGEVEAKDIALGLQKLLDIKLVGAVHVINLGKQTAVKLDAAEGIKRLKS